MLELLLNSLWSVAYQPRCQGSWVDSIAKRDCVYKHNYVESHSPLPLKHALQIRVYVC